MLVYQRVSENDIQMARKMVGKWCETIVRTSNFWVTHHFQKEPCEFG